MTFIVKTYGCQMNVHETEKIEARLFGMGYTRASGDEEADIVVFNTCCVRDTAEQKIISHIGNTGRLKRANPKKIICVVGCLSQRENSAQQLRKKFPFIDIILGTHNIVSLGDKVKQVISNRSKIIEIKDQRDMDDDKAGHVMRRDENAAYINITFGCENYCAYCIVPYVRGKLVSRKIQDVQEEFRQIINGENPPRVVFLLGQNVNSYVCPETGASFITLLEHLCDITLHSNSPVLINFLSSHPKDFSKELVETIASNQSIERNIHLPLQSGCDKILKLMNRGYTVQQYTDKIQMLRQAVPGVCITTDIICGFPGETEEDFEQTIETVKAIRFNAAFIFPYSRRTGTVATKMEGQVDMKVKKARTTKLIKLMRELSKI